MPHGERHRCRSSGLGGRAEDFCSRTTSATPGHGTAVSDAVLVLVVLVVRRWPGGIKKVHPTFIQQGAFKQRKSGFSDFPSRHSAHSMLFAWWLTCGTPRTLEPHGVFDFGRCFQVRIDVTVEAKQLQAHGGGSIGMLGGGLLQKLRKNYGKNPSNPMVGC